jgi:integrase
MAPKPRKDKDGRTIGYYDTIELGRVDGKRPRKYIYGKTKAEVRAKMKALQDDQARGVDLRKDRLTVAQFLRKWIERKPLSRRKGQPLADRTWDHYVPIVTDFLIPRLGHFRMSKLTPGDVEDMRDDLLAEGRAPSYVAKIIAVGSKAFARAERDGIVARNVFRLAGKPDATPPKRERPTDAHIRQLLASIVGDADEVLIHLLVKTGMRKSEALAVRVADLDFNQGTVAVTGTVERAKNSKRGTDGEPLTVLRRKDTAKSASSIRVIALAPSLLPLLRRRLAEREIERAACEKLGRPWVNAHDLVFTNPTGGLIDPRTFFDRYKVLTKRAGWPASFTVHDLRHANITTMITSNQVDVKTAQEMAGHSDPRVTLGIYTHTNLDLQRAAAATIDARFGASSEAA